MQTIGLLFESRADLLATPATPEETHYHWREPEEIEAVTAHLTDLGYAVDWIGPLDRLLDRWQQQQLPDFIWNLSVRAQSRNRTALAPALLEQLGLPYTGGDAAAKSLVLNKDWLKPVLQSCGVATPPWQCYRPWAAVQSLPPWPLSILKPACEGYSLGLTRFESSQGLPALQAIVEQLWQQFPMTVLCEPLIAGREITVGVVGNRQPLLIGAIETVTLKGTPIADQVLDLQAKRRGGFQKVSVDLAEPALQSLQTAALTLMQHLGPLDYATFDFRVTTDGPAYLLDVNADATLHPERSLAQIALAAGFSYGQLIEAILQTSLERWGL